METLRYPAKITQEDEAYIVLFRDLEGCHTFGDTLEEARAMAQEALDCYLEACLQEGIKVNRPSVKLDDETEFFPSVEVSVPLLLRFCREDHNMTMIQMANAMDIAYQNYQAIESGKRKNLTLITLKKAFAAIGCQARLQLG
ncbi:type II toxin-antitoxin system HicB family antitoxin [Fastidiosibacter lacustris]|uniref:type II toxin-antitoxin system HicB family antitoxin n=1 Tax=Fastidiosibacter lacustris TaxID=2056695 RepID=UPI000E340CF4|nr:type II toxin-antitoxin system HicB family antitoxin [Fastidiosibacter lacustris]